MQLSLLALGSFGENVSVFYSDPICNKMLVKPCQNHVEFCIVSKDLTNRSASLLIV